MRLIATDYDANSGITEEFWHDELNGKVIVRKLQDVQKHLDQTKEMHNRYTRPDYSDSNGQHLVARIPLVVIDLWREKGFDWFKSTDKERRAWLDKEENAVFKTRPGKLNGVTKSRLTSRAN